MANTTENAVLCGLNRKDFQTTINGKKTDLFILRNRKGYEVAVTNFLVTPWAISSNESLTFRRRSEPRCC